MFPLQILIDEYQTKLNTTKDGVEQNKYHALLSFAQSDEPVLLIEQKIETLLNIYRRYGNPAVEELAQFYQRELKRFQAWLEFVRDDGKVLCRDCLCWIRPQPLYQPFPDWPSRECGNCGYTW
jgi:hypothetical protein